MKPIETLQTTDVFSWQRTAMVARYFRPLFIKKLTGFFILSILFYIGACFSLKIGAMPSTTAIFFNLPTYILILSPLVFGARRDREIFRTLPALKDEKCTVIAIFCFILVPIAAYLPSLVGNAIFGSELSTADFHINTTDEQFQLIVGNSSRLATITIFYFALFATCLWGALTVKLDKLYYIVFAVLILSLVIRTVRGELQTYEQHKALTIFDSLLLLYGVLMMWRARKAI